MNHTMSMRVDTAALSDISRIPLVYALPRGDLCAATKIALTTAEGLAPEFKPVFLTPPGKVVDEAQRLGFAVQTYVGGRDFVSRLWPYLVQNRRLVFFTTGVRCSWALCLLNLIYRRTNLHLQLVGGAADGEVCQHIRALNWFGVDFVAVSSLVRDRLIAGGITGRRVTVIENFLRGDDAQQILARKPFTGRGIRRVTVFANADPKHRIELLLDALDQYPDLNKLRFAVFAAPDDASRLRSRAKANNPGVSFADADSDLENELVDSDLLLYLNAQDSFGEVILKAFAARVPVLASDDGAAAITVEKGYSGFHFRADDASSLGASLLTLSQLSARELNSIVEGGLKSLQNRFSVQRGVAQYRQLVRGVLT